MNDSENNHEQMVEKLKTIISKRAADGAEPVNDSELLKPEFISFSKDKTLVLKFPLFPWQRNGQNNIQGGIISCMMDLAFGVLSYVLTGGAVATVDMTTNYVKAIGPDEPFITIEAKFPHIGRRILHGECKAANAADATVASASTNIIRL